MSRLVAGVLAGVVAIVTGLGLAYIEARAGGVVRLKWILLMSCGAGGGTMWLVDQLGWLKSSNSAPTLSLSDYTARGDGVPTRQNPPERRRTTS